MFLVVVVCTRIKEEEGGDREREENIENRGENKTKKRKRENEERKIGAEWKMKKEKGNKTICREKRGRKKLKEVESGK